MVKIKASNSTPAAPNCLPRSTNASKSNASRAKTAGHDGDFYVLPFTIIFDDRERTGGWKFQGFQGESDEKYLPLVIPTREVHLVTGDYSILGYSHLFTIERKSLSDLYNTLSQGRERFEREHERMAEMIAAGGFAAVMVEASMQDAFLHPEVMGVQSGLAPKVVARTRLSWQAKYGVPWFFEGGRREAEDSCWRTMRFWWEFNKDKAEAVDGELGAGSLDAGNPLERF